jgi:hypothetical protein
MSVFARNTSIMTLAKPRSTRCNVLSDEGATMDAHGVERIADVHAHYRRGNVASAAA